MNIYELEKIKDSIESIRVFNLQYYKFLYSKQFKNATQKIQIRIEEEKFTKLFKNAKVMCEERDYKQLNKEISCCKLLKIFNDDIVIVTYIFNYKKGEDGIKKIKKFSKLEILKEE